MKVEIVAIELDASIQCRAFLDAELVAEYAEHMKAGDEFPPVDLFGSKSQSWIGDGWHRIMAAQKNGATSIEAKLHRGGRVDALKHALGANAVHGRRRSNADKRRCVEIALREFAKLSSRAIAEMCGVSDALVASAREPLQESRNARRTTKDGRQYPAQQKREPAREAEPEEQEPARSSDSPPTPRRPMGPPSDGMQFARMAILDLEQIQTNDTERTAAFDHVKGWIANHEAEA